MASDIVNVEDEEFAPTGNGSADDQAALQSAFNAAASGVLLFPDASKTYAIKGFGLKIRRNTRIINAGARLRLLGSVPKGSGVTAIAAEPGLQADNLLIEVGSAARVNRALSLQSNTSVGRLEIWCARQQSNFNRIKGAPYTAALDIRGSRTNLGFVSIRNFDRAVLVREARHVVIQYIEVQRYVTGVYLKESKLLKVGSGMITGASLTDVGDRENHGNVKGMNGLLVDTCEDIVVSDLIVHDSIEHGVRIGGSGATRRCFFSNIQVHRAGKCGFKAQPNHEDGGSAKSIQINGLMVTDCAAARPGMTEEDRLGVDSRNRSGLRVETCQDVVVNGFHLGRRENKRYSAFHGIYIAQCKNVTVNAPQITDTFQSGIKITDEPHKFKLPVNEIYIRDPIVTYLVQGALRGRSVDGIRIDSTQEILRNIVVSGCYVRGHTGYGVRVTPPHPGGALWPVIVEGWARNEGKGHFRANPDDVDIRKLIAPV